MRKKGRKALLNLHCHNTCEGRGFHPFGLCFHLCSCLVYVYVFCVYFLVVCVLWVGLFWEDSCCFRCFVLAYLKGVFLRGFHGFCDGITHPRIGKKWPCMGKGHSWTSLVRVSSHGERRKKRVGCMGPYLSSHACNVEKLSFEMIGLLMICSLKRAY